MRDSEAAAELMRLDPVWPEGCTSEDDLSFETIEANAALDSIVEYRGRRDCYDAHNEELLLDLRAFLGNNTNRAYAATAVDGDDMPPLIAQPVRVPLTDARHTLHYGEFVDQTVVMGFMALVLAQTTVLETFPVDSVATLFQHSLMINQAELHSMWSGPPTSPFVRGSSNNVHLAMPLFVNKHFVVAHYDGAVVRLRDTYQALWASEYRVQNWAPRVRAQAVALFGEAAVGASPDMFRPDFPLCMQQPGHRQLKNLCGPLACAFVADIMLFGHGDGRVYNTPVLRAWLVRQLVRGAMGDRIEAPPIAM